MSLLLAIDLKFGKGGAGARNGKLSMSVTSRWRCVGMSRF